MTLWELSLIKFIKFKYISQWIFLCILKIFYKMYHYSKFRLKIINIFDYVKVSENFYKIYKKLNLKIT